MAKTADYKLGEFSFPRGWFVVADSAAVEKKPYSARYFGEDVVLFRGQSGAVAMLEAYCPHMGTHLGRSQASHVMTSGHHIDGDSIRCPFHGWRFGLDGKCTEIPYFGGPIPKLARVRSWPVQERYGLIFCWNDPEGRPPDFELPDYPEWDDPQWMRWAQLDHLADLPCHPVEIFDNTSDFAHLNYLHGGQVRSYENEIDGHYYRQRESMVGYSPGIGNSFQLDARNERRLTTLTPYTGPGLATGRFLEANAAQLIATTPIEDGSARLWQCAMIKRPTGMSEAQAREMLVSFNRNMAKGLGLEDAEIWANKRAATQIMQLPTDGPFWQARTWYSQFFNPRDRAPAILERVKGVHGVRGVPGFPAPSRGTAWS
jgi:3-ketosteroid 9alpha-monooxygenase subunit A